jgi:hypothetical protein
MGHQKRQAKAQLEFDQVYARLCGYFSRITDQRGSGIDYPLDKLLRLAFAMFSLKHRSLLDFRKRSRTETQNLDQVYGVDFSCSDNALRTALDEVCPDELQAMFAFLARLLKHSKVLSSYEVGKKQLLLSIDGVEYFHSQKVCCNYCLERKDRKGELHYYHQMLVAVVVHPDHKEVFPICCEPIIQQDGSAKNDCERNAAKRLIERLRTLYPDWRFIVVEDALYSNGPHVAQLQSGSQQAYEYLIGVKPADHKGLFAQVASRPPEKETIIDEAGLKYECQWANNLPLNQSHADLRVNFLKCTLTDLKGKRTTFSWIAPWKLSRKNIMRTVRWGRSRWKIENETFNTLKNQGYHFEHNYGHGHRNLSVVLAILMLLAFCVDQIQQRASTSFRIIWHHLKTKQKLWTALRAVFMMRRVQSMQQIWEEIAWEYEIQLDTS